VPLPTTSSALLRGSDVSRRSGEKGAGSLRTGGVPGENVTDLRIRTRRREKPVFAPFVQANAKVLLLVDGERSRAEKIAN
jgi:hypothetical protein